MHTILNFIHCQNKAKKDKNLKGKNTGNLWIEEEAITTLSACPWNPPQEEKNSNEKARFRKTHKPRLHFFPIQHNSHLNKRESDGGGEMGEKRRNHS